MNAITLVVTNGQITTTSNLIAEHFGKRHDTVLRAVDTLECSPEFRHRNFAAAEYLDEQGKPRKAFTLTRDGFVFLCMGFTGKEAAHWKEKYIAAFNAMEAKLHTIHAPYSVNKTDALSKEEADLLRDTLRTAVEQLPKEKQGIAMVQGWSKLKAHFGCNYRMIPQAEFSEAMSLVGRHIADISPAPALPAYDLRALVQAGNKTPELTPPPHLLAAINARAWTLCGELYEVMRESISRRVAYQCELGVPRKLNEAHAATIIEETTLDIAIAPELHNRIASVEILTVMVADMAKDHATKMHEVVFGHTAKQLEVA